MTFEQAMAKARELEAAAWRAIALDLPEKKDAVSACVRFNPYRFLFK